MVLYLEPFDDTYGGVYEKFRGNFGHLFIVFILFDESKINQIRRIPEFFKLNGILTYYKGSYSPIIL